MLILKQNAANTVPTPPAGKGTIFLNTNDDLSVKSADGNVTVFPTAAGANTQVYFNDDGSFGAVSNLTFNKTTSVFTVTGNVAATNVLTDNLLYANGTAWDLSDPGGSNTQIQFNDDESFGGSAALTFNKSSNLVTVQANLNANNLNATTHITSGNVWANSGTIGAQTLKGEGGNISNIQGANVSGTVSSATTAGTVTTAAQPNITSVGTLSTLNVGGNAVIGGNLTVNGDLVYVNVETLAVEDPIIQLQSGPNGAAPTSNSGKDIGTGLNYYDTQARVAFMGWDVSNAEFGMASQASITNEVVTFSSYGNLRVGNIIGNGQALTGLAGANVTGEVAFAATANAVAGANVSGTVSSATTAGTVTTAAQPNITSVGTLSSLAVTANVTAGNVYANSGTIGAQTLKGEGGNISNIQGANVSGTVSTATTAGTVTTAAQPNITSVGTLSSLSVTANVTAGNVYANSGTIGAQTLKGEGGNISNIQGANVSGAVASATSAGSATTAGTVTTAAQPNITSVGTLSSLSVTGNTSSGNFNTGGTVLASTLESNVATGTAPLIVASTTKVANLNADLLDGFSTATAATANTVVIRDADGSFSANVVTATLSGAATTAGTVTTAAQPNITSVGTLTSLGVTGNISAGNVSATTFTGALSGAATTAGTVTTAAQPNITSVGTLTSASVTGNVTAGNVYANSGTIGASLLTGTLTTAAQPNVTSVGTLTSLSVTGNVSAGNVSGTLLTGTLTTAAQPNITSVGTLTSATVTGNVAAGNLTTTGVLTVSGTGTSSIAGNLDMTGNTIANLATPSDPNDAATKQYVDDVAQGLHTHDSCGAATPDTLANITGGTITYNNGTAGVGANLVTTGTFNLIDGVNVQTAGTRILVKNEANSAHNGIYVWSNATVITRASDFDTSAEMAGGDFTFVTAGTLYDNTGWVMTDAVTTVGTSPVVWVQFSGAGTYTAGTGLTLNGSQFNISNTTVTAATYGNGDRVASFTVNAQGQLTAASNVVIAANAANLTGTTLASGITTSSLTTVGTLGSLAVTGNATAGNVYANSGTIGASLLTGTLTTAAQPNITSVGTLTSVAVTGNVTAGNVYANSGTIGASLLAGTLTTAAQPNITSVGTLTSVAITGNATAGNVYANSGTIGATNLTGTLTTAAQPNITSVGTLTSLAVTGNVTAGNANVTGQLISTVATGTAPFVVTSTTQVANLNVATAGTAGTVTASSQPNITSVGTLTSLNVSGNITAPSHIANTGYLIGSVNAAVSAAGTVQGNATVIASMINVVSTVASGAGVILPTAVAGMRITIMNTSANALLVYPNSGGSVNTGGYPNTAYSQPAGARLDYIATSTTQWYTLNATYG